MYKNSAEKYLLCGRGKKTVVFLHGAFVRPDMWFYPITKLEEHYHIIAPRFSIQAMGANDAINYVRAIMEKEHLSKSILIGYSYGGDVAQYFAEKYPDFVDKLILTHTGLLRKENDNKKFTTMYTMMKILSFFLFRILLKRRTS